MPYAARSTWTRSLTSMGSALAIAALAACSDSPTAPNAPPLPTRAPSLDVTDDSSVVAILPLLSNRYAYVWADNPLAAFYVPAAAYSFNAKGGANTITRTGIGAYTVHFGLMAKGAFPLANRET